MSSSINGRKASEIFEGQVLLYKHLYAFIDSMSLKCMVQLGIPDIIHNHGHPITLKELVSILKVPQAKVGNIQRLMRCLTHNGLFEIVRIHGSHNNQEEEEAYSLTVASELLVKKNELCLAPMVEFILDPTLIGPFNFLKKWIYDEDDKTTLFNAIFGLSLWDFLNENPTHHRLFNEGMASDSGTINWALRDCGSIFEGLETVVDVGGGTGTTAKILCETFRNLKCIVFERPQVMENLPGSNNVTYVGGDMFNSIPKADAVLLKWILHDWNDTDCIKILGKCKEAVSSNGKRGKVIIIDVVINETQEDHTITFIKLLMDVNMACINGKERNEEEWKKLFTESGFRDYKISPLTGLLSIIEIYP